MKFKEWYRNFFSADRKESMLRLLSHYCVVAGVLQVLICTVFQIKGFAIYGIELVGLGLFGKGYQEYNKRKGDETKSNNNPS